MTSECLQAFLFCGSHCTTVDLNYGGKNGVSGHLVTLRLPPLTLCFVQQQKHSTMRTMRKVEPCQNSSTDMQGYVYHVPNMTRCVCIFHCDAGPMWSNTIVEVDV